MFLKRMGGLVLFIILFTLVSFSYGLSVTGGLMEEWVLLDQPPGSSVPFEFIDVGFVQMQTGEIYHYTYIENGMGWVQVNSVAKNEDYHYSQSKGCGGTIPFMPIVPQRFIEVVWHCESTGLWATKEVFAVSETGLLYAWSNSSGEYYGIERFLYLAGGVVISLLVGIIFLLIASVGKILQKKKQA